MTSKNSSVLVAFGEELPKGDLGSYDTVLFGDRLKEYIEAGSIYEATQLLEELSLLKLPDGTRIAKSFTYQGYELWWIHYSGLFLYFCLPYTQYKKLLSYLKDFQNISFYQPTYKSLFSCYLGVYGCKVNELVKPGLKSPSFLPFGIFLQICITLLSLPVLILKRSRLMVFIGDRLEPSKDYDFRMGFIYQELRQRKIAFVEFSRSLEPWKKLLEYVFIRKRPIIYSEAVVFIGRFLSFISRSHYQIGKQIETDPEKQFKISVATHYLHNIYNDVWSIRIMKWILRAIGVKAACIITALESNFHATLGCKLNAIPTVGILHGVASRYYNGYDFLPSYDGEKNLSVDKYGLWSEWWKEYYIKNSKIYLPEQLYVSGPMRPLERTTNPSTSSGQATNNHTGPVKVLFVSEQLAVPDEVVPYLTALVKDKNISVYLTFRPYRDSFENWLREHHPEILVQFPEEKIIRTGIKDALSQCEVAIGTMSTAVIEALFQHKVPILFYTKKWGDYFSLKEYEGGNFFADAPEELIEKIKKARSIPREVLKDLQERYFGDPYQNGSKWVVDQLEGFLATT